VSSPIAVNVVNTVITDSAVNHDITSTTKCQPSLAHAPLAAYPEFPPGQWQKCGEPPLIAEVTSQSDIPPWRKSVGGTGLPAAKPRESRSVPYQPVDVIKGNGKTGLFPNRQWCQDNTLPIHGTVLILFSGPKSNKANLQHALRKLKLKVEAYDLLDGSDLADDAIWVPIRLKLEANFYSAFFASPPCNSFSRLRGSDSTGPQRVRSVDGPERYGLDSNSPEDKQNTVACTISLPQGAALLLTV
jgi:hypothetical protein